MIINESMSWMKHEWKHQETRQFKSKQGPNRLCAWTSHGSRFCSPFHLLSQCVKCTPLWNPFSCFSHPTWYTVISTCNWKSHRSLRPTKWFAPGFCGLGPGMVRIAWILQMQFPIQLLIGFGYGWSFFGSVSFAPHHWNLFSGAPT